MNLQNYSYNRFLRTFLNLPFSNFSRFKDIFRTFSFSLLPIAFCFLTFSLFSQTIYTGADGGSWFTATNWSNGLPAAGNDATVPSGKTVVITQALTVNFNIQSFGGINNTSTLTLATNLVSGGLITNSGTLTINSGITLTSSGGINNSGTINNNGTTNSNSVFTNLVGGLVNNNSSWTQQAAITNSGSFCANAGTFTCPQVFTNNAIVKVLAGATFKVDFGGSYTNAAGSTLTNGGAFSNLGTFLNTTTVTNTGVFTNNSSYTCNGIFNNESGGSLVSTSTVNINGRINNKLGGTVNNSFNFNINANGYFSNAGGFTNGNTITVLLGGTFVNEATGVVTTNFGSSIVDGGYLKNSLGGQIAGNGSITTTKKFDNLGLFDAQSGSQITIGDTLNNSGTFNLINIFNNNGCVLNSGTLNLNSGGTLVNNLKFVNLVGGKFTNAYEFDNKVGATTINNGNFTNNIRVFNDGSFTNNAYLLDAGDFFNRLGATLINTELIEVNQGSIVNDGTIVNTKSIYLDQCSVFTNRAAVNNTGGAINSSAIVFQRGTVTGNAINKITGYIQTASTSTAAICRTSLSAGTDLIGEAKVYGQNPVLSTLGIDSCAGFQYSVEWTPRKVYTCAQVGTTITGHFTLLVRTGDSLTCTLPITIFDGVAPQFTNCPSDVKILTANTSEKYSWATIAATDNCSATPTIVSNIASGSTFNLGTTGVVVTARDASNNARDCRFNVTLVSAQSSGTCTTASAAPSFTNCPANISVTVPFGNAAAVWTEPTVSGVCLPIQLTQSSVPGALFPAGLTIVTYTATDVNNKVGTCSFTVNVTSGDLCATDNIAPVITNCPANIFVSTNTIINGAVAIWKAPSASDNCSAVNLVGSTTSGSVFPVGTTNVVYTATDTKNNTSTCSFTINVGATNPCAGDITPPTITGCPANITQTTTSNTVAVTWTEPTASDACAPVTVNKSNIPGSNFSVGVTTVNYSFSDKVGNISTCSFNVTINNSCFNDTIAPVLGACPANITVTSTGATATASWTNPTATDICSTASVISTPTSGSTFTLGVNTVTVNAFDARGNKSSCTFTVTVNANPCATDVTPPVLGACPANISVTAAAGATTATATWTNPTATDNCSTATVTSSTVSGSSFNIGVNTVTVTATDAKLNKSTCTFTVTVNAAACVSSITRTATNSTECSNGSGFGIYLNGLYYTVTNATFTEKADLTANLTATSSLGAININFTGRTTTGTPVFNSGCFTPASTSDWYFYNYFSGTIGANVIVSNPMHKFQIGTSANNHNQNVYGGSGWYIGTTGNGDLNFLLSGNTATLNQITCPLVSPCTNDITAPSFVNCPASFTKSPTASGACATVGWTVPTATDNCTTPTIVQTAGPANNACLNPGNYAVAYTATDAKNNKSTCSFMITVNQYVPTCKQPATPAGYVYIGQYNNNYYYKLTSGNIFYGDAKTNASNLGGHLPFCKDAGEKTFLANNCGGNIWIGLERSGTSWKYTDGSVPSYMNWATGEPNNYGGNPWYYNETVVQMYSNGYFNDANVWTYNQCIVVLPCVLSLQNLRVFTMSAAAETNRTRIEWFSNTGLDNDYFQVEKLDAQSGTFQALSKVATITSSNLEHYISYDNQPSEGDNFYRIKATFVDGTYGVSEIQKVNFKGLATNFSVYPNPTDDELNIDLSKFEGKAVNIAVFNAVGQQVYQYHYDAAPTIAHRINTDNLSLGAHLLKVDVKGLQSQTKQFVIAR